MDSRRLVFLYLIGSLGVDGNSLVDQDQTHGNESKGQYHEVQFVIGDHWNN